MYIVKVEKLGNNISDGLKYTVTSEKYIGYVFDYSVDISCHDEMTEIYGDFTLLCLSYNNEVVELTNIDSSIDINALGEELTKGVLKSVIEQMQKFVDENK